MNSRRVWIGLSGAVIIFNKWILHSKEFSELQITIDGHSNMIC